MKSVIVSRSLSFLKRAFIGYAIITSSLLSVPLHGAPGCMDNSFHADPCVPYDYKNYHYVECNCRCERYSLLYTRGRCGGCHHYRVPQDPKLDIRTRVPSKTNLSDCLTKAR